ncbi:MAG: phytase [Pseudomonadales bacterium]|nr:phytase [Pseudomonadales bacterium]
MSGFLTLPFLAVLFSVVATGETAESPYQGDSIDDAVLWVNPNNPSDSLILATLKASNQKPVKPTGLLVYNLSGEQLQFLPGGTPNNIDIRYEVKIRGISQPLIAASNWWSNHVSFYTVDSQSLEVRRILDEAPTGLSDLRGLCLYKNSLGEIHYFAIGEDGQGEQYLLSEAGSTSLVNRYQLASAAEGCVVDDQMSRLYISEEKKALWRFSADEVTQPPTRIMRTSWFGPLRADLEGLTIYQKPNGQGFLIASSQGNSHYLLFDRQENNYIGRFKIDDGLIDNVTGTDGIFASNLNLGNLYPEGVLIVQDHMNIVSGRSANQNFKLIDWRKISLHLNRDLKHE